MNVHQITPILNVASLEESFAWFEKLGWAKAWDFGDGFGAVRNIRHPDQQCENPGDVMTKEPCRQEAPRPH